jgi:hypothetical protein
VLAILRLWLLPPVQRIGRVDSGDPSRFREGLRRPLEIGDFMSAVDTTLEGTGVAAGAFVRVSQGQLRPAPGA